MFFCWDVRGMIFGSPWCDWMFFGISAAKTATSFDEQTGRNWLCFQQLPGKIVAVIQESFTKS